MYYYWLFDVLLVIDCLYTYGLHYIMFELELNVFQY